MTQTYQIDGMHCGSCIAKVKHELFKLGDVTEAEIQLNSPQATITMERPISADKLQQAVSRAGSFIIREEVGMPPAPLSIQGKTNWLIAYKPLLLAFAFITGIASLTSWNSGNMNIMQWMNNFMGGFFLTLSFFKLLDIRSFADNYRTYDLLAKKIRVYGLIYPFIELGLGLAYISNWQPFYTNMVTVLVMGFSTIGVIETIVNKKRIRCACLGSVFNVPVGPITLIEDLLMVTMALFSLFMLQ